MCRFLPPEFGNFSNLPVGAKGKIRLSNDCYCNFGSDFAHVRASKIPLDQLKLLLNLLVAERGGRTLTI